MKKYLFRHTLLILFIFAAHLSQMHAKVRLPQLVSDKMVLQRDAPITIWGWADAEEWVTVRFLGEYYETQADASGSWQVILPPQSAGGPYIMEVNEITLRDILIGDVWLCSGQSNQETPIARLAERFPEINVSNNHMIRHYKVPTQNTTNKLQEEIAGHAVWHSAVASEVMNWTALAYFYAQEAYRHTGVPVGMLVSSLGGSAIESWVAQEHLKEFPHLVIDKEALHAQREAGRDKGVGKWNQFSYDDTPWPTMPMPATWRENGLDVAGVVWFRKDIHVPASMAGRHAKLKMGTMVDADEVYINGVLVGTTGYQYPPRNYHIPAGVLREGKNVIAVKLTDRQGNGGFVKDKVYQLIGDTHQIDLTGTWKYQVGMDFKETESYNARLKNLHTAGSGLYNGMIYPLRNYKVKGCIWYQGETNTDRPHEYEALMNALITNWRQLYQMPEMPFLLVQLPNFMEKRDKPSDGGWARLREAQLKASQSIPHTALVVTYDTGEWNDIHPLNKKTVGKRLFLAARKLIYGERITASGPVYKEMRIDGNKIILTFDEVGKGLKAREATLKHFAIAGEDRRFVWADAVIRGNKIVVSSAEVAHPVAVRYAWADNPEEANLLNRDGLLASPFRTDNW